jgi:CubicO group peptidase (beta-lactamase class C family)
MLKDVAVTDMPGEEYHYQSGSTQLLGFVVMRATGKSLAEYASESFWIPMGAENPARWHTDSEEGVEIAYCCFNTNARDLSRFGLLALHHGNWRGQQILDSAFFPMATTPYRADHYGYSYWLDLEVHGTPVYYMRGRQGQYVVVIPEHELVFTRLGFRYGEHGDPHKEGFRTYVGEVLKMYGNK